MSTNTDHVNRQGVAGIVNRDVLERAKQSQPVDELEDRKQAPLSFRLIKRLLGYLRAYPTSTLWLLVCVLARGIQLPVLAWAIGAIINGPIAHRDPAGLTRAALGFLAFAFFTEFTFHFRVKLAQQLGEQVVHDIRRDLSSTGYA